MLCGNIRKNIPGDILEYFFDSQCFPLCRRGSPPWQYSSVCPPSLTSIHTTIHNNDEDRGGILKWFLSRTISKMWMFFRIRLLLLSPETQKLDLRDGPMYKKRWFLTWQFLKWQESADSVTSSTRLKVCFTWQILFAKYHLFAGGVLHTFGKFGWRCDESGD